SRPPRSTPFPYTTLFRSLLFMMAATAYLAVVIVLEAWPVYTFLQGRMRGEPIGSGEIGALVAGIALALAISAVVIVWPLRLAARSEEHTSELQSRENLVC